MPISNLHQQAVFQAGLRAARVNIGPPHSQLPHGSMMTALMKHGGLYTLLDPDLTSARLGPLMADMSGDQVQTVVQHVQGIVESYFYKLCPLPGYSINSDLMSFIAFPHDGVAYEKKPHPNKDIPAVFTFVGQFIDHDLTMNAVDLTIDQSGAVIVDNASPVIDLDSMYGPRAVLDNVVSGPPGPDGKAWDIFESDGTFKLSPVEGGGFDLPRFQNGALESAYIVDARNDENQLILQIHILLMRVHNKLVRQLGGHHESRADKIAAARKELVLNWQSVILHDYMPKIIPPETLAFILREIKKPDYGELKHKPYRDLVNHRNIVRMPHEFAIGFRFGHSQLRPEYQLNSGPAVLLFNNREVGLADDLRGSRKLAPEHVIDWDVFYPLKPDDIHQSLLIDGRVTPPVFDLPETAIPDDIKYVGNLPQRNLIRSRMIGVVSGEELAEFFEVPKMAQSSIVDQAKYPQAHSLFTQDGPFKTPLWYYILKEAETTSGGHMLGPLGSRLVGEVLAGAIYYSDDFRFDDNWQSQITGKNQVTLRDLIYFATQ